MTRCGTLSRGDFTQTDPLPMGAGSAFESAYAYGRNNPVRYVDPTGLRARVGAGNPIVGVEPAFTGVGAAVKAGDQSRLGRTIAAIERRTSLDLSDFVASGLINSCVKVTRIKRNGVEKEFKDSRCHRGLAANGESTYTLKDGSTVEPGEFVIGENAYATFGPEGEMGIVFHEIVHLLHSVLSEGQDDCLVQHYGIKNEKKGKQNSLTYRPSCSSAQKQEAASLAGVG